MICLLWQVLRIIRIFRVMRVFKMGKSFAGLNLMVSALRDSLKVLAILTFLILTHLLRSKKISRKELDRLRTLLDGAGRGRA